MRLHEFIFSEKRRHKLVRHAAFWACCWLYFLLVFLLYQQIKSGWGFKEYALTPGYHLPVKTFLLVLLFAFACYPLIYFIFPKFITRNWLIGTTFFILLCTLLMAAVSFLYWNVFPFIDSLWGSSETNLKMSYYWPAANLGLINFVKVAAAAAIIKYVKYWWLKQKESLRLEKEKINTELQLLKAQVHPDFLFKTLNNIYSHALSSSPRTSGMLLKLSDLLSYMLYECDQSTVYLEKEIEMMKEYMVLEKMRYNDEPEIEVNIKGDMNGKMIAPFLMLPFIENSFKHCGKMTEQSWINLNITIERNSLSMKLSNGIAERNNDPVNSNANGLANVQKRLALLYPDNYELKMVPEQEMFIVFLSINLNESVVTPGEKDINSFPKNDKKDATIILNYASE